MGLVGGGTDDAAGAARARQRTEQHVGGPAPGGLTALEPVPLDLVAGRVLDLDGVPAGHARARLAVGPQADQADLASEGGIAAGVTELADLVEKRARPYVRVVDEPGRQVRDEPLQCALLGPPAYSRLLLTLQVVLDRPPVSSDVAADRCLRPPSFPECIDLHVFSLCDHDLRAPSIAQGTDTQSMGGAR